ncbi:MAG: hypothetical protein WED04_05440 [Promethearchaeati archaeon SRVP18_Atabeyarchaeia-1]
MLESEAYALFCQVFQSLENGSATYLVDDYLSGLSLLRRNPTRSGDNVVYFTRVGHDHSRSITYLVNAWGDYPDARCKHAVSGDKNCLQLVAGKIVSAVLAMRAISTEADRDPPIDVSLVLLGSEGRRSTDSYFNVRLLRENTMCANMSPESRNHVVVIESTGLRVCNVQKGCLVFKLAIRGRLHSPAFAWLGDSPWEALTRFGKSVDEFMKPRHHLYPVEYGKAPSATIANFLIGYPSIATTRVASDLSGVDEGVSSIASYSYVTLPPECSHKELMGEFRHVAERVGKNSGCQLSVEDEFVEQPFREDARSFVVNAISEAFLKVSGFEPIFEWLPFPVSARDLKESGFATDVVVFGPGDWTTIRPPNEKDIVAEIIEAAEVLAKIPYEAADMKEDQMQELSR